MYDFTNLYELRNACYNLDTRKIINYANQSDSDEVISLLLVLEGQKRTDFINGLNNEIIAETAEDLHASELVTLLEELNPRKREQVLNCLSDHVLYRLSTIKKRSVRNRAV